MIASIVSWLLIFTIGSVLWDLMNYEHRQNVWEREHPGLRYEPHYRRNIRNEAKARRRARNAKGVV